MNLFEYLSESRDQKNALKERRQARAHETVERRSAELSAKSARTNELVKHYWTGILTAILALTGAVLIGQGFVSTHTKTTGSLMWKHTTTTHVSLGARLGFIALGIGCLAVASVFAYLFAKRLRRDASDRRLAALLQGVDSMGLQEIAARSNQNAATAVRDLERMIGSGELDEFYVDHAKQQVIRRRSAAVDGARTIARCPACGASNEVMAGAPRPCSSCGEPLMSV